MDFANGGLVHTGSYSNYYHNVCINSQTYVPGSVEYHIGAGECDYNGYIVIHDEILKDIETPEGMVFFVQQKAYKYACGKPLATRTIQYEGKEAYLVHPYVGLTFNLTQHEATPDQLLSGVQDLNEELREKLKAAITFSPIYTKEDLLNAAKAVESLLYTSWDTYCNASAASDPCAEYPDDSWQNHWYGTPKQCMIGGMPSFMPVLETYLKEKGWKVGYACTDRVSVDVPQPDGSVKKGSVFKHVGMFWS